MFHFVLMSCKDAYARFILQIIFSEATYLINALFKAFHPFVAHPFLFPRDSLALYLTIPTYKLINVLVYRRLAFKILLRL
jgi:hypothetical protein